MTLGQRIQELRKQRGMSQEALGDALGVSRQAVSKWEGDNGIPELDTLIAMSRLFEVTVGQLLGVEEAAKQECETAYEADENQEDQVEAVLRRYVEQTTKKDERSWFERWGKTITEAIVVTTVFVMMLSMLLSLRSTVKLLQSDLSRLQVDVSNNQSNVIGMTVMMVPVAVMVVCLSSHVHNRSGYSQHRRVLVLNELADILCNDIDKKNKPNDNEYLHFRPPVFCKRGLTST